MEWEKAKKIFIYILVFINIGLFALNYKNSSKYNMSSKEEAAIYKLLNDNNIEIKTNIIKKSLPMRALAVTTPVFNNDEVRDVFFDDYEEVKITIEFDSTIFESAEKIVVMSENSLLFKCPNGTGDINNFNSKSAVDTAESFMNKIYFYDGNYTSPAKVYEYENGYKIEYNQDYGNEKIFCGSSVVYVTQNGVKSVEAEFYVAQGYTDDKKQICSCDEALLTVFYDIKSKNDTIPEGLYIEKIEKGYTFQSENDISEISVLKLVPAYRIYVYGIEEPYIIDAYTNTLSG
jgi:regulatory protein YycI of two-component signal transduction system YycFG